MLRRITTILTLLSLVLILASSVAWWRSTGRYEGLRRKEGPNVTAFGYSRGLYLYGNASLKKSGLAVFPSSGWEWESHEPMIPIEALLEDVQRHVRLGVIEFHIAKPPDNHPIYKDSMVVVSPMWFVTLVFAVPPALRVLTRRRRHRRYRIAQGLCVACGYDLRGSEGACPECSAVRVSADYAAAASSGSTISVASLTASKYALDNWVIVMLTVSAPATILA
jgi:hypothetical protein